MLSWRFRIARKMGATIWLVAEDICQVRSRLVVTFIGKFDASLTLSVVLTFALVMVPGFLEGLGVGVAKVFFRIGSQ